MNVKKLLGLLRELDDLDVLILEAFGSRTWGKLQSIRPETAHLGSSTKTREDNEIFDSSIEKLERLGLLRTHVKVDRQTGIPEFDNQGKPKGSQSTSILGRLILRSIGLLAPEDS